MQKHKGKYRNESRRLRGWDYSRNGHYFITINTYNRACLFGDIKNGKMILNDFGKIATDEWYRSFEIRNELILDEFILMPDHLQAIVGLKTVGTAEPVWMNQQNQPFQRKPKSISSFVARYKSTVLNKIDDYIDERQLPLQKFNRKNPLWQANYYDHIIRDNESYRHIAEYIRRNPAKWNENR